MQDQPGEESSQQTSRSWYALAAILLVPAVALFAVFKFFLGFRIPYAIASSMSSTALIYVTFLKELLQFKE